MQEPKLFSADSHVNEPPEAWERIPKNLREHGPRFVQDPLGKTFTAGKEKTGGNFRKVIENFTWEDWRGPWDAHARLGDMDLDGVKMEALYPSMARNFYSLKGEETPLQKAGLIAYNDWL